MAQGVLWLHRFIDQLELVDEHKSYFLLSEMINSGVLGQEDFADLVVFYGFDFITGSQVDLLNSISNITELYIPIYKLVYEHKSLFDWMSWLESDDTEVIDITDNQIEMQSCDFYKFSKNYLSKAITNYSSKDSVQLDSVVLGTPNLNIEYVQEVPLGEINLKSDIDIFNMSFLKITDEISSLINVDEVETDFMLSEISREIVKKLKLKEFKELKSLVMYQRKISSWKELSDENFCMTKFDFKIIQESVMLDLPRLNISSLNKDSKTNIESINSLEKLVNSDSLLVLSSFYQPIGSGSNLYTESVEKYLSSVGPVRRSEFDKMLLRAKVKEYISNNRVTFLCESSLFEHDANLNFIFEGIDFINQDLNLPTHKELQYLKTQSPPQQVHSVSATKLQKYIDCPKKYELSYLHSFSPKIKIRGVLDNLELGRLQHAVIESYFHKNFVEFNVKNLDLLIKSKLKDSFTETSIQFKKYFIEIK